MKHLITTLALLLAINFAGISTAHAAIKIYVKNCADKEMTVHAYNARDSALIVPYQTQSVSKGEGKSVKCKGQGKGFCKVRNIDTDLGRCTFDNFLTKVDKNKWIKITDCESYEKNLSSEPSCD